MRRDGATGAADATQQVDALMTSHEVCALLRVHKNWLAEARCDRRIDQPPYIRIGALIRYERQIVMEFLAARTVSSAA